MFLRQSTSQTIKFGPFLDSTDGVTPETGLTITQSDMQISKDGGAYAQKNTTGNATHDTDGWYSTTLDATDTATNAELIMQVNVAGSLPVWVKYYVVPASTYDALTTSGLNNISATDIVSNGAITTAGGKVSSVGTVDITTTNTDMRGTDAALLASSYTSSILVIDAKIDLLPTITEFNARTLLAADYFVIGDYTAPDNATVQDTNTRVQGIESDYSRFDPSTQTVDISVSSVSDIFAGGNIDGYSLDESLRVILSASAGELSGAATNNVLIRDTQDTKNRIDANVDVDGNRTSVTLDVSA